MRLSRFPILSYFVLVFAFQAVVMTVSHLVPASWVAHILWPYLANPSVAGLLMILWLQGLPGIRSVIHKLTPWALGRAWPMLAVSLLLPLAWILLTVGLMAASGADVPSWSRGDLWTYLWVAVINKALLGPGLIEEIGWRGFALPCLQRRYSALASSLIIGVVWALWHVPNFIDERPFPWLFLVLYIVQVSCYSIIFTWVYNTTGGSLLAVMLLHGAINSEHNLPAMHNLPDTAMTQILVEFPALLVAATLLWCDGPSNLSRSRRLELPRPDPSNQIANSSQVPERACAPD
jgi:uncharacterized protein